MEEDGNRGQDEVEGNGGEQAATRGVAPIAPTQGVSPFRGGEAFPPTPGLDSTVSVLPRGVTAERYEDLAAFVPPDLCLH